VHSKTLRVVREPAVHAIIFSTAAQTAPDCARFFWPQPTLAEYALAILNGGWLPNVLGRWNAIPPAQERSKNEAG
jgi:hypothetical protein